MKCSTRECSYICDLIRVFLVGRSHIQTHEQNIQLGSQTEAGMKRVNNPLFVELYQQLGLHRKPHHLMLQNNRLL